MPGFAHPYSAEQSLYLQTVQLKPMWVTVCISRNQVWNAKIFLCLMKIYWLTANRLGERGQRGEGETHLLSFATNENIQYQESWIDKLICLQSASFWLYYEKTFNKGIKKQEEQQPCIASEHWKISPHADRMINSSELQVLLRNMEEKRETTSLLKFNTYSKLLIIPDGFQNNENVLRHFKHILVT